VKKYGLLVLIICFVVQIHSNTVELESALTDILNKSEFNYDILKRQNVVFNIGSYLSSRSNFLVGENSLYYSTTGTYPFELAPNRQWESINSATIWGSMVFEEGNFIKLAINGTFLFGYESVLPVFNLSELYISWKYSLGRIVIGRTLFALNSQLNFSGTLDGIGLEINAPFINFKSFVGFTGFTGVFHPYYNNFNISAYDKSFFEQTNLTNLVMVVQLNGVQSRRIFLSTDFDIHYLFFNVNPYFLMQLDISNIDVPNFKNTDYIFNTFTIGLLNKIRIWTPLYFYFDVSGVFGVMQDIANVKTVPISAFGLNTELRYTFTPRSNTAFSICYATGSGTPLEENKIDSLRTSTEKNQNYVYYGKFNGGYVLDPVLYNIHSIGLKFISNINSFLSGYIYGFQTFKMYSESPVSDSKADINDYIVGTEIDAGLSFKFTEGVNLSIDAGVFIPETAYTDKTPRLKAGIALNVAL